MNYEDFKSVIAECVQNPDLFLEKADSLAESYKLVNDTLEAQNNEINSLKSKNDELRDSLVSLQNKILMRQSFAIPEEKPEKSKTEIMKEIFDKINS